MTRFILAAALILALPVTAAAASFDCARARAADERAICDDRALNDQDVRMSLLLDIIGNAQIMGANGAMRDDQRTWLAGRRRCGADRACLAHAYDRRVGDLLATARANATRLR